MMTDPAKYEPASRASIDALIAEGAAAMKAENVDKAIAAFSRSTEIAPNNATAWHNLGCALFHAKRLDEAARALLRSVDMTDSPLTWRVLGELYESAGRKGEAFRCYKNALKHNPDDYVVLMKLGALREGMGDKPGSRDTFHAALRARPGDLAATIKYAPLLFEKDPQGAVGLWEQALASAGDNLGRRTAVLEQLVCRKEWAERIKRGEMPYHAARLDELHFNYARNYAIDFDATQQARLKAGDDSAYFAAGFGRFALNDRAGAERLFRMAPKFGHGSIFDVVRFDPAFYDELRAFTDADVTAMLPPVREIAKLAPETGGILYLSCNLKYFTAFTLPMMASLRDQSPQTPVHIHIMDADENEAVAAHQLMKQLAPVRFALTVERPGLAQGTTEASCYYHAIRFIRFYEHLRRYGTPLWIMDVDALVNRSFDEMFARLNDADVSLRIRPGRLEPWNQFSACAVGAKASGRSLEYVRLVAAYLAYFFQRKSLRWGIDQLAMYGVYADMQDRNEAPSLSLLGSKEIDFDYCSDSFVWCNAGVGKFQHLQRVSKPDPLSLANFEGNKYVEVFERYWKECERISRATPR